MEEGEKEYPNLTHIGIPNGVCLFHEFLNNKKTSTKVIGQNRQGHLVRHYFSKNKEDFLENEEILDWTKEGKKSLKKA